LRLEPTEEAELQSPLETAGAYKQAAEWLNENVTEPSRLAMAQSVERSMPRLYLSEKIVFSNTYWSGFDRRGEYLMELTHNNNKFAYPAVWDYVETVLEPVYEEHPGWLSDTGQVSCFEDLPVQAQRYLKRIEELLDVKVSLVSVGSKREQAFHV